MKVYCYTAHDIGLNGWPDGQLRFDGPVEIVQDPKDAELFICPGPLVLFNEPSDMDRFAHLPGNERRHVFFDVSENCTVFRKDCIYIRCNLKTWMLAGDTNSISWPWPVENYAECVDPPEGGFTHDVSFHGWLNYETRINSTESCLDRPDLKCDMARYPEFTGYLYSTPEGIRRRQEFRNSMKRSRIALCPESIPGDFPYRFFEAMSAGRVPALVGREQVLPFEDEIPYSKFVISIDRGDAPQAGLIIQDFLKAHSDDELIWMGKLARRYWLRYLNRDHWPRTMYYAVQKKMRDWGLTTESLVELAA